MKILVLGKTGQVGTRLAQALPGIAETIVLGRETADLAQPGSIREAVRTIKPDVIVNAAAYTDVDRSESEKDLAYAINASAPGVLAEEAKRLGALLVHYSTDYVFDGSAPGAYAEIDTPNPINEYGRSKLAGERAIIAVGCAHLILRVAWVYDSRGRNFVMTILRLARERDELRVVDDQIGSPTWARSIAEATAQILRDTKRVKEAAGLYNLTAAATVNRYDFARRILEMAPGLREKAQPRLVRTKTSEYVLPAARPLNTVLDNTKLRATFGVGLDVWDTQLSACLNGVEHVSMRIPHEAKQG